VGVGVGVGVTLAERYSGGDVEGMKALLDAATTEDTARSRKGLRVAGGLRVQLLPATDTQVVMEEAAVAEEKFRVGMEFATVARSAEAMLGEKAEVVDGRVAYPPERAGDAPVNTQAGRDKSAVARAEARAGMTSVVAGLGAVNEVSDVSAASVNPESRAREGFKTTDMSTFHCATAAACCAVAAVSRGRGARREIAPVVFDTESPCELTPPPLAAPPPMRVREESTEAAMEARRGATRDKSAWALDTLVTVGVVTVGRRGGRVAKRARALAGEMM